MTTKKNLFLFGLVLLMSLLDLAVFSRWSFRGFSPQLFVVVVFFSFSHLPKSSLVWFVFFFYLFGELIYPPRFPGVVSLVFLGFFSLLNLIGQRLFKPSRLVSLLFFFLINGFYFLVIQGRLDPARLTLQFFLNLLFYLAFYPVLLAVKALIQGEPEPQLHLRI